MTSSAAANGSVRDPLTDHLLTPQNCALIVVDYQPSQVGTVTSIDHQLLTDNIVSVARIASSRVSARTAVSLSVLWMDAR